MVSVSGWGAATATVLMVVGAGGCTQGGEASDGASELGAAGDVGREAGGSTIPEQPVGNGGASTDPGPAEYDSGAFERSPAVMQWYACQCGGSCEGAEEPLDNIRVRCRIRVGETDETTGEYMPCEGFGLHCGVVCATCEPGSEGCNEFENAPSTNLCDLEGRCVPATEVSCL